MTAPGGVRRWTLHRRDCKKEGGYGEFRDRFSPWIECKWPNEPHDPPVERPYKTGPNATHVELVEAAAYDALSAKLAVAERKLLTETAGWTKEAMLHAITKYKLAEAEQDLRELSTRLTGELAAKEGEK